jgi:hypothetical protein
MAARDFSVEQEYFLSRHRLHNRVLHGWGVVCGLRVVHHPDPECRKRWVVVKAGIGLDCCGREVVLFEDRAFELPLPAPPPEAGSSPGSPMTPAAEPHKSDTEQRADEEPRYPVVTAQYPVHSSYLVCIKYVEQEIEKVPALYNEGACDPARQDYNRVRECVDLVALDPHEVPGCWRTAEPVIDPTKGCCDDCDEPIPGPAGICLEPQCPCKDTVALALVDWAPTDPEHPLRIHMDGRRTLPTPPEFLTHIRGVNWPHGGTITLEHLRDEMHGRLEVYFDRKILPANGAATGINDFTFVVQYGDIQRGLEFMPMRRGHGPTLEEDCRAVCHIDREILTGEDRGLTLSNHVVFVTIYCDFILDCHDNPVDGNFLGGKFPTGNGVKGSTFRSWFRVR